MFLCVKMCISAGLGLTDEDGTVNDDEIIESFYNETTAGEAFAASGTVEECETFADTVTVEDFFNHMMEAPEEPTDTDKGCL